jgi:hypothetical protein
VKRRNGRGGSLLFISASLMTAVGATLGFPPAVHGQNVTAPRQVPEPTQTSQAPFAEATLSPAGPVTVGQPVTLTVTVLVPSFFQGAPAYADLDLDGTITLFNDRGTNLSRRIEGTTWAGQSRSYTIYPQRPGTFDVSDVTVEVRYRGDDGSATSLLTAPPLRFEARVPAEAEGLDYFIAASRVTLESAFDVRPDTIRVGDAFTWTLTASVFGALSIVIPPLEIDSIPGIAVYANQPRVVDTGGERGAQIVGTRVESTTYVMQEAGEYGLPAAELLWWDVDAERMRQESIAGVRFVVVDNPDLVTEFDLPPDSLSAEAGSDVARSRFSLRDFLAQWGPTLLGGGLLLAIAARLVRRVAPGVLVRIGEWRSARAESEATFFRAFRRVARSGGPQKTANALMAWMDRWDATPGPTTLESFVRAAHDPELDRQTDALAQILYGGQLREGAPVAWSAPTFSRAVARARRRVGGSDRRSGRPESLAPLNPLRSGD